MTSFLRQFSTLSLLTCLLFLNGLALPQVVTHTLHHAKHTADTHRLVRVLLGLRCRANGRGPGLTPPPRFLSSGYH